MAVFKVVLMIAVTSLVIVAYAQEAAHEDLELAETKGKKLTRHIQHNNRPSQPRFRPRIRTSGKSGRGRSDSSENGGSNGGDEYDANDGYIIISYGGSLGKGKKGQRYGNKYGSDYNVEYFGNVYGYEDDHGYNGEFYDNDYNAEQDHFKVSSGASDGNGESTGTKVNSESTGGSVTGGDAGGSDVTSGTGESEGSKGNSGSMSESTGAGEGSKGNSGSMVESTGAGEGSKGNSGSMVESTGAGEESKGNSGSMVDSTVTGGDAMVDSAVISGDAMGEEVAMGETGSKGTGESIGEGSAGGDVGAMGEMGSMGDVKEGEMGSMGDVKEGEMGDIESVMEVSNGETMGAESDAGDATGDEESKGTSGSMANGEDAGGDDEKSNSGKSSSEMGNIDTKGSSEAGGSAEDSEYIFEFIVSEDDELEEDASNKGSVLEENISKDSPAMTGKDGTSTVTMETEKGTGEGSTSDSSAKDSSSAKGDKGMSIVVEEMLKMAQMIKIDEMIKNGEMSKIDEMLKNAEKIKPEGKQDASSVTMENENKASADGTSSSNSGGTGQKRIERNGNSTPRPGKQGSGDRRSIVVGKRIPDTSTNRDKQVNGHVSSKSIGSSTGSREKPPNSSVNVHNAGSPRSKPVDNQWKPIPPRNISEVNGNRNRRPSGNMGKVSSVPRGSAKILNVPVVNSKPVRSSIESVGKEKKLPGNGEGGKSNIRSASSPPIISTSKNSTTNTSISSGDGERRFLNMGNRGKQEKGASSGKSVRSPSGAIGNKGKTGPGNVEKVITRGIKPSQSKPAQEMKPPSKLRANPMMGDTRPTFFTETRLKVETTTEKSIRNEKRGRASKNSVKEKRGIPSSASVNSKPISNTSAGNKGEKGSKGFESSKGNGKREIVSSTTNSPVTGNEGSTGSVTGEKQNSGFVRNASPLSIVRYLRKGIGRYL